MDKGWQEVRDDLKQWFGEMPLYPAAVALLDHLEEHRPEMVGFHDLEAITGVSMPEVFWVAGVLTGSSFSVLDAELAVEDNGKLVPLPKGAHGAAERDGYIVHPVDGRVIHDWQKHVYPRFRTRLPESEPAPAP